MDQAHPVMPEAKASGIGQRYFHRQANRLIAAGKVVEFQELVADFRTALRYVDARPRR